MENNNDTWTSDIEKVGHEGLVRLTSDMTFNYPTQQLKDEIFHMFMSYVQALETELCESQKAHVFHFARLYDFYDGLESKIGETKNIKGQQGNK